MALKEFEPVAVLCAQEDEERSEEGGGGDNEDCRSIAP